MQKYHVPNELKDLRIAEQMLIQRLSPYVPIVHLQKGKFALKRNCCTFRKDIQEVCNNLPTKRIELIKYMKFIQRKNVEKPIAKILVVRRTKVMKALYWLKRYHIDYRDDDDLVINEQNLNWMNGKKEAEITSCL